MRVYVRARKPKNTPTLPSHTAFSHFPSLPFREDIMPFTKILADAGRVTMHVSAPRHVDAKEKKLTLRLHLASIGIREMVDGKIHSKEW